jgi:hypothetical protein
MTAAVLKVELQYVISLGEPISIKCHTRLIQPCSTQTSLPIYHKDCSSKVTQIEVSSRVDQAAYERAASPSQTLAKTRLAQN